MAGDFAVVSILSEAMNLAHVIITLALEKCGLKLANVVLNIKSELDYIARAHNVIFAFGADFAGFFSFLLAAKRN